MNLEFSKEELLLPAEERVVLVKLKLLEQLNISSKRRESTGGQVVGIPNPIMVLECEHTGIKMECNYYRSKMKNKNILISTYEKFLDEVVK